MLRHIPPRIRLAQLPSPLRELQSLSRRFPRQRLWLKQDELTGMTLSGNKVRKLEFLLADAIEKGCDTVITCGGVQSNHCRATAFACAELGLRCELILRDDPDLNGQSTLGQGNHVLSLMTGAQIELLSQQEYTKQLNNRFKEKAREIERAGRSPYLIPTGGSNGKGVWGYVNAAKEILEQCQGQGFNPDLVVCASGSGGTQAGLTLGFHELHVPTQVLGMAVCDSEAYFQKKVAADINEAAQQSGLSAVERETLINELSIQVNADFIGPGYALGYSKLYQRMAELAREEAVLLDPVYTGKAMHGLLSLLEQGQLADYEDIVFVHTGGAFGVFPQAAQLMDTIS
ncbi:D-cysteine desulfhydrase family protein [Agaribacterium sp. ZY112]|uniref:D-cysteine desulfhydrase family protein n=1 Tax=Agaribacterium sp. ZY112 TaxID=3233574 RepID=UPI0035255B0C